MRIDVIIWNRWNTQHIKRHKIMTSEVDEILLEDHCESRFKVSRKGRLFIAGVTSRGRYLVVIVAYTDKYRVYPVTARGMTEKERRDFKTWLLTKK